MRIGYCTISDPNDKRSWSGTHYNIMKSLESHCGVVVPLGPLTSRYDILIRIISRLCRIIFRKNISYTHTFFMAHKYSKLLLKKIKKEKLNILFTPAGSSIIAFLDTNLPIVYLSDTTFHAMINYYPRYTNLLEISSKMGDIIEEMAIERSSKVIFASEWAAESAKNFYGANDKKIFVVPFGANIEKIPSAKDIATLRKKESKILKLLFIGVEWIRKGGNIAFDTLIELNKRGIETELILCGCTPPPHISHDKLRVVGFLNKNIPEHAQQLKNLFLESSFLIFPTRNEAAGIVSCEAAAYGLPVIATNTGGVPTYVENGKNGFLIHISGTYIDFANKIEEIWKNKTLYHKLSSQSRDKYDKELNWETWGLNVKKIMEDALSNHQHN